MSIDTSKLAFPKHPPAREPAYLDFIRGQVCAVQATPDFSKCQGRTEAAHLETAGRSLKASDYLTVPLCSRHHSQQHTLGMITFQMNHGINLWEVCAKSLAQWSAQQ